MTDTTEKKMSFTTLTVPQNVFLENYLRGTRRGLTEAEARARFGIRNLRARMTELRQAGLVVRRESTTTGRSRYMISSRDVVGSRARVFAA